MAPPAKPRIEHELDIAKLNAKNLRSSNLLLSKQLDNKNFELIAKDQEILQLKSVIAKTSANIHGSTDIEAHLNTPPNQQRTIEQERRHLDAQEQYPPGTKPRKPKPSPIQDEPLKAIQSLLEIAEKEKEALRKTCGEQANEITKLEAELTRILHENEIQHSRLEDCLEENATLSQTYSHIHGCYQKLQMENTKVAGFKRSLAVYLSDVGFSRDDFTTALESSSSRTPAPKDDTDSHNAMHDYTATPVKHHTAISGVLQPDSPTPKFSPYTEENEFNSVENTFDGGTDDDTVIVARTVTKDTPNDTEQTTSALTGSEVQERDVDENEHVDDDHNITNDGDNDLEDTTPESETDSASEYDPGNDWNIETGSDRGLSSAEDSDYAL